MVMVLKVHLIKLVFLLFCISLQSQLLVGTGYRIDKDGYAEVGVVLNFSQTSDLTLKWRKSEDINYDLVFAHNVLNNWYLLGGLTLYDERRSINMSLHPVIGVRKVLNLSESFSIFIPLQYDLKGRYRGIINTGIGLKLQL